VTGRRPNHDHSLTPKYQAQINEENQEKSRNYHFAVCELDADRRELRVAGNGATMQPKIVKGLLYLVCNRHTMVNKDLMETGCDFRQALEDYLSRLPNPSQTSTSP
jgi:DNA-binding response OmpR family regulator